MKSWYIIDTDAKLNDKQALRYAISSMLAASAASLLQLYVNLSPPIFLMFVISSAIFSFFSYGNTLIKQTLMIMIGVSLGSLICFLGGLLAHFFILALIYLIITTFILYLYSTINIGCLFFTKFNLVLLAFALLEFPETSTLFYAKIMLAILSGGLAVIVINTFLYFLGNRAPWKIYLMRWDKDVIHLVTELALMHNVQSADKLVDSINQIKPYLLSKNPEFFLIMERTTHALVKWLREIQTNPYTLHCFTNEYLQFFKTIAKGLENQDATLILKADSCFTAEMNKRREAQLFTKFPYSVRTSFAESFFLLNKFSSALAKCVSFNKKQDFSHRKTPAPFVQLGWKAFTSMHLFEPSWKLTVASKIALRAAITMGVTYIVAYFYFREYAAWIVLTANLVIQIRKGDTIKKCMDRILGHFVGAIAVILIAFYIWPFFDYPVFWVPILTGVTAYYFLKNYFIYGIFFMIILVYLYVAVSPAGLAHFPMIHFTLIRLRDVSIGAIIALLTGLFIFPNIGLQPLYQTLAQLFDKCGQYLLKLSINSKNISASEVFNERQQLVASLLNNEQLFKTMSFQPDRYRHHQRLHRRLLNKQSQLIENIEALTRRMYHTENEFIEIAVFCQKVNLYINQLQQYLTYYANHVRSELKQEEVNFSSFINPKAYDLSIELEKTIEIAFSLSDNKKISYESLISYLGVIHSLREINQLITSS